MTGGLFAGGGVSRGLTTIRKALPSVTLTPSLTEIRRLSYEPTSASDGVPDSIPLLVSNETQAGRFARVNVSRSFSGSEAAAMTWISDPAMTLKTGDKSPMVGG